MNLAWVPDILTSIVKASEAILKVYERDFDVSFKPDHSPITKADTNSNEILVTALKKTGILILSEEEKLIEYEKRKNQTIWLLDPLDGTREFVRKSGEFCICLALIENEQAVFGIIANPLKKELIIGGEALPAMLLPYSDLDISNKSYQLQAIRENTFDTIIHSRTHITPKIDEFITNQTSKFGPITRIKKGSALKFFDLVCDKANLYIRLWPTMEWDIAAGHAIYKSLGGEVFDFTTFAPLTYNKANLINPAFIAKPKNLELLEYKT